MWQAGLIVTPNTGRVADAAGRNVTFAFTWVAARDGHGGKVLLCGEDARQRPSCSSLHTAVPPTSCSTKKTTSKSAFQIIHVIARAKCQPFKSKDGCWDLQRSCLSSDKPGLLISWGPVPPAASDGLTRGTGTIHLGADFCSVVGVSFCRQNKNAGNHPKGQSYILLLISSHLGLQGSVFYTVSSWSHHFQWRVN